MEDHKNIVEDLVTKHEDLKEAIEDRKNILKELVAKYEVLNPDDEKVHIDAPGDDCLQDLLPNQDTNQESKFGTITFPIMSPKSDTHYMKVEPAGGAAKCLQNTLSCQEPLMGLTPNCKREVVIPDVTSSEEDAFNVRLQVLSPKETLFEFEEESKEKSIISKEDIVSISMDDNENTNDNRAMNNNKTKTSHENKNLVVLDRNFHKIEGVNNLESTENSVTCAKSSDLPIRRAGGGSNNVYDTKVLLMDLFKNHTDSIFCECKHCCRKFETPLKKINFKKESLYKFTCDVCNKRFRYNYLLTSHKQSKCGSLKLFSCSFCAHGFIDKYSLLGHIKSKHDDGGNKKIKCTVCNKRYETVRDLINHKKRSHNKNITKIESYFKCVTCHKVFQRKNCLRMHITRQHNGNIFECAHCSKTFPAKSNLAQHIQVKHLHGRYKCDLCSSSYYSVEGLEKHKLNHQSCEICKSKNFLCEVCGKSFRRNKSYQRHRLTHSEDKPYLCNTCGKGFRTSSNLLQHSVIHSDEKKFECNACGKSFKIRNHLRQHMAVHGMVNTSRKHKKQDA